MKKTVSISIESDLWEMATAEYPRELSKIIEQLLEGLLYNKKPINPQTKEKEREILKTINEAAATWNNARKDLKELQSAQKEEKTKVKVWTDEELEKMVNGLN